MTNAEMRHRIAELEAKNRDLTEICEMRADLIKGYHTACGAEVGESTAAKIASLLNRIEELEAHVELKSKLIENIQASERKRRMELEAENERLRRGKKGTWWIAFESEAERDAHIAEVARLRPLAEIGEAYCRFRGVCANHFREQQLGRDPDTRPVDEAFEKLAELYDAYREEQGR